MAILSQDTYLEGDRYYKAFFAFRSSSAPSLADLNVTLTDNHLWYWELGSSEDTKRGITWRWGYMKAAELNLRSRSIAKGLGAVFVAVDDADINDAIEFLLAAMEVWAPISLGVNPAEGATFAAQEVLAKGNTYAVSADWDAVAPETVVVVERLAAINVEVVDIDACGSFDPLKDGGNPFGDQVNYFADQPYIASFCVRGMAEGTTAGMIRDALCAKIVYIPKKPSFGVVDTALLTALCPLLEAMTHISFAGSRFSSDLIKKVGKIADLATRPWWVNVLVGTALGGAVIYGGYRLYYSNWATEHRRKRRKGQ